MLHCGQSSLQLWSANVIISIWHVVQITERPVTTLGSSNSNSNYLGVLQKWVKARDEADFIQFAPVLQEWVDLLKKYAGAIDSSRPIYDVLLDDFEKGMTSSRLDEIFTEVTYHHLDLLLYVKVLIYVLVFLYIFVHAQV